MTTISKSENDGILATDACPSSPKEEKRTSQSPGQPVDESKQVDEEIEDVIPPTYKINSKKKQKTKKLQNGPIANIINIANCNGVQIGKNITYNIQRKETKDGEKKYYHKTGTINKLLNCGERLTEDDLMFIATHVGEGWRDIGRKLKYSEGQIYQFEETHRFKGIKEVVYQMLLDWIQTEPKAATLGKLNTVLWETQQEEVVKLLSEKLTL